MFDNPYFTGIAILVIILLGIIGMMVRMYRKASQGQALVKTGVGGVKVSFNGMIVVPVIHKLEIMDISLKTIVIARQGKDGLVCKDNMRADIKVAFFVRVNPMADDVKKVAEAVGCERASSKEALVQLFEAKFSEALKTVGKKLDFVELYDARDKLKLEIISAIGRDLNGYKLDDAAIDYLEQTPLESLDENNILDAEGIKKITQITAHEKKATNLILREKEKVIRQQDVEAREAILELDKQLAETEEKQKREIASIKAREEAEVAKVQQEEFKKSENARIATEEEIQVAEENKQRQVIIAGKNKERTAAVETERVEKDRALEATERERLVTLAQIEKEKVIEVEKKNIQEVIRERVAIEKTVVDEEEIIKDTRAFAEANRSKQVAITAAEQEAESALVAQIKAADASKQSAEYAAKQRLIEAEADQASSNQRAQAIKTMAEAEAAQAAALGMAEAQVMEAKAAANEKEGDAQAAIIEATAEAEAKGIQLRSHAQAIGDTELGLAHAKVDREQGLANAEVIKAVSAAKEEEGLMEAKIMKEKYSSEAAGIEEKANAMKKLDAVGKDHEEFKLKLDKEKQVDLARINVHKDVAQAQAEVIGQALKSAHIDIVGGDAVFFDKIVNAVSTGKSLDAMVNSSDSLTTVKEQLLDGNGGNIVDKVKSLIHEYDIDSEDLKNLSISALLLRMMTQTTDESKKGLLHQILDTARGAGVADQTPGSLGIRK